jgi:hypothetical protein
MRHLLPLLALLACSAPPLNAPGREPIPAGRPQPPVLDQQAAVAAFQKFAQDPNAKAMSALVAPSLQPQAFTFEEGQLTVVVTGALAWQRCDDGTFLCTVPWDRSARVTAVLSSRGPACWGLNMPGPNNSPLRSFSTQLPLPVGPRDALWAASGSEGGTSRPATLYNSSSQSVDEATAVAFVEYDCDLARAGKLFRPPAWGRRSPLVELLRQVAWRESDLDWSVVPSKVDFAAVGTPDLARVLSDARGFPCDLYSEWGPYFSPNSIPYTAHQGYGTFFMGQSGLVHLVACSTLPLEQKKPYVRSIIQRGIDTLGGLCDESWRYNLGGHCWGRRADLVWLGRMWHFDPFGDPTPFVGKRLPEDMFVPVTSWWGEPNWVGYIYSWTSRQDLWSRPPSGWGDRNDPTHAAEAWQVMYGAQVIPAMVAHATSVILIGGEQLAPLMCRAVRCYVKGPPPAALQQMWSAGVNMPIGPGPFPDGTSAANWGDYAVQPAGVAYKSFQLYVQNAGL